MRPCLWLALEIDEGFLALVSCLLRPVFQRCSKCENVQVGPCSPSLGSVEVFAVFLRVLLAPPSRPHCVFSSPHLCHAACRIVVMAEDTKSLVGAWHGGGGGCRLPPCRRRAVWSVKHTFIRVFPGGGTFFVNDGHAEEL